MDLWTTRDFPVLRVVTRAIDAGRAGITADVIAQELGMTTRQVVQAAAALQRQGLVTARVAMLRGEASFHDVDGQAYYLTGLYPDPGSDVEQLVDVLRRALAEAAPEERGRLQGLLDGVLGLPANVVGSVLAAWAAARFGIS